MLKQCWRHCVQGARGSDVQALFICDNKSFPWICEKTNMSRKHSAKLSKHSRAWKLLRKFPNNGRTVKLLAYSLGYLLPGQCRAHRLDSFYVLSMLSSARCIRWRFKTLLQANVSFGHTLYRVVSCFTSLPTFVAQFSTQRLEWVDTTPTRAWSRVINWSR